MENKIILYSNEFEKVSILSTFLKDTFWIPQKANAEYEVFRIEQDKKYISDLDKELAKIKKTNKK
ncbi:MAG: hypothetical protein ORN58_00795 [Sediminibacterium sp.]|nr:hypothetical protein [Sediminibacterium sp.]